MSPSRFTFAAVSVAVATLITLTACGGSSGSNSSTSASTASTSTASATTPVAVTVVDGLIRNAKVCVDSNNNGACDAGEIQGTTDANGQVTIAVPTESLGTVKIIASVGTDAVDVDNGAVTTPFTMTAATGSTAATTTTAATAPASAASATTTNLASAAVVISPLTTMVQTKMETDKVSLQDAINYVKTQTGLTTSPLENFVTKRATSSEHRKAGDIARLLVLSMQKSKTASTTSTTSTTSSTSITCPNGTTKSSVEEDKEIAANLSKKLGEVRRAYESNESDNDDSRKKSAPVVSGCGGSTTTTTGTTGTTGTATGTTTGTTTTGTSTTSTTTTGTTTGTTTTGTTGTTTTGSTGTTSTTTTTGATTSTTSASNGKALFASSCASCHGATNTAMGISASTTLRAIAANKGGMGMLSSTIGSQQAADIAAYAANPAAVQ